MLIGGTMPRTTNAQVSLLHSYSFTPIPFPRAFRIHLRLPAVARFGGSDSVTEVASKKKTQKAIKKPRNHCR
jgi:hypothetical protein